MVGGTAKDSDFAMDPSRLLAIPNTFGRPPKVKALRQDGGGSGVSTPAILEFDRPPSALGQQDRKPSPMGTVPGHVRNGMSPAGVREKPSPLSVDALAPGHGRAAGAGKMSRDRVSSNFEQEQAARDVEDEILNAL